MVVSRLRSLAVGASLRAKKIASLATAQVVCGATARGIVDACNAAIVRTVGLCSADEIWRVERVDDAAAGLLGARRDDVVRGAGGVGRGGGRRGDCRGSCGGAGMRC